MWFESLRTSLRAVIDTVCWLFWWLVTTPDNNPFGYYPATSRYVQVKVIMKQEALVDSSGADIVCSPDWLRHALTQDQGKGVLLLDCRSHVDFHLSHVMGAMHVTIPSLMLRRLEKGNLPVASVFKCHESKERFNAHCKTDTVVLYDDCSTPSGDGEGCMDTLAVQCKALPNIVSLLANKLKNDGCRVRTLKG